MQNKFLSVNIGHLQEENLEIPTEITVQSLFSSIEISKLLMQIAGKEYVIDVQELLKFNADSNEISDLEIENTMEKISSWAFTMGSASIDLKNVRKRHNRIIEKWKLDKINEKRKSIAERDPSEIRILRAVLKDDINNQKYNELIERLDNLDTMIGKMDMFFELILKRNESLRSILKRRDWKGGRGKESSI